MLRTYDEKFVFSEKNVRFVTALNLNECIKHIRLLILLNTGVPFSELPYNINTDSNMELGIYLSKYMRRQSNILCLTLIILGERWGGREN